MPTLRVGLDNETYAALLADAERHLRPGERHMAVLLRQALGLPVPLLPDKDIQHHLRHTEEQGQGHASDEAEQYNQK
jgi:hypothetical protein